MGNCTQLPVFLPVSDLRKSAPSASSAATLSSLPSPRLRASVVNLPPIIPIMSLLSDPCLCLRKTEYSETSQILTLFSRNHGLLRVIAKGAHRTTKAGASKFGGGIDLLDLADAVFTHHPDRDLATLTAWSLNDD